MYVNWHDRRDELKSGMVFETMDESIVMLDRRCAGDGSRWHAQTLGLSGWSDNGDTVEPGELMGKPVSKDRAASLYFPHDIPAPAPGDAQAIRAFVASHLENENFLRLYFTLDHSDPGILSALGLPEKVPAISLESVEDSLREQSQVESLDCISYLPGGGSGVCCTDYARQIAHIFWGRVAVVGFANDDNPTARAVREEWHPGGHDFAVLDNRFLIDVWPKLVLGKSEKTVYDLADPDDRAKALETYGPRECWGPLMEMKGGVSVISDVEHKAWEDERREIDGLVADWRDQRNVAYAVGQMEDVASTPAPQPASPASVRASGLSR